MDQILPLVIHFSPEHKYIVELVSYVNIDHVEVHTSGIILHVAEAERILLEREMSPLLMYK